MEFSTIVGGIIAFAVFFFITQGFKVVQQSQCVIIERLGSYQKTLNNGF